MILMGSIIGGDTRSLQDLCGKAAFVLVSGEAHHHISGYIHIKG